MEEKKRERKLVCDDDDGKIVYTHTQHKAPVCVYASSKVVFGAGKGVSLSLERTLVCSETASENLEATKEENNHNNLAASRELKRP